MLSLSLRFYCSLWFFFVFVQTSYFHLFQWKESTQPLESLTEIAMILFADSFCTYSHSILGIKPTNTFCFFSENTIQCKATEASACIFNGYLSLPIWIYRFFSHCSAHSVHGSDKISHRQWENWFDPQNTLFAFRYVRAFRIYSKHKQHRTL